MKKQRVEKHQDRPYAQTNRPRLKPKACLLLFPESLQSISPALHFPFYRSKERPQKRKHLFRRTLSSFLLVSCESLEFLHVRS